jgi:homoserine O-acetyltransferase
VPLSLDELNPLTGTAPDPAGVELHGARGGPIVVALGGISASGHVAANAADSSPGWWEEFVGTEQAIDPERYRVLGIDYIASAPVSTEDQARHLARALDRLHVDSVHAIVGSSYGGMVALAFAALFPSRVSRLVIISAAHESHPMATAWRVIQRRIARLGIAAGRPREGLGLARALAITTYRTAEEFAERFAGAPQAEGDEWRWPVEAYLDHHARRFASSCPAERFLALSESIDLHRVDPALVTVPVTLIAVAGDTLVPPWQMAELKRKLPGPAALVQISSIYGHDAFLKHPHVLAPIISTALGAGE